MTHDLYARCICQLFRVHSGDTSTIDSKALQELMEHQPPLVRLGSLSRQRLTEDGLRVVGELIAAFEEAT